MSEQRLYIEIGSAQRGWERMTVSFNEPDMFYNVIANVHAADQLVSAQYQARVVDETGNVKAHLISPYEGITIDLMTDGATSLDEIREDYGISKAQFAAMCRAWLEANA